ncbi:hypothetical protein Hanom_Chr07g00668971 [Helianthus anomalus]
MSLEELLPANRAKSRFWSIVIRTGLVLSILVVALTIPFFGKFNPTHTHTKNTFYFLVQTKGFDFLSCSGLVMSLVGSLLTMLVTLILPCVCFLSILKGNISWFQGSFCALIILVGIISSAIGTYTSILEIIHQLS